MTLTSRLRSFLVRGLAVLAVVFTYAVGTVGTQVASVVGLSAIALTTSTTPAQAWRRYRRRYRVVRRYRREPSPLVRNADGSWRTGKYDTVLGGNFDLLAAAELCWMSLPRKAGEG